MGWEDLAPHCGLSMGPDGMATAAEGSGLPPWSLKGGFAGEGSTLGARSLALRSQLPGVIWGRLSQDLGWSVVTASLLLASGFPRVFLGTSFLRTPCRAPWNPFHKHLWKHSTPGTKFSRIKPLAELILTTAQTLERGTWAGA